MSDENSLTNTANRLSLAAAILAAAAFVVSFLQALLQYSSAGNERDKCNACAIHISKKMASRRWDFLGWKWRYLYPELDLTAASIFAQLDADRPISIEDSFLREIGKHEGNGFRSLNPENVPKCNWLHDGLTVLYTRKQLDVGNKDANDNYSPDDIFRAMTTKDLTWSQYFRWRWWLFRNPQQPMRRPRATWAQVLRALGCRSVKKLRIRNVDAGTIPEYIDVPIQRIKLFELGILCFSMGFTSVKIDIDSRKYTATGPFGSVTTENIQNFGKVLRFEGDMFAIHSEIRRSPVDWIGLGAAHINGRLSFGRLLSYGTFISAEILVASMTKRCSQDEYDRKLAQTLRQEGHSMLLGHVRREASFFYDRLTECLTAQINNVKDRQPMQYVEQELLRRRGARFEEREAMINLALARWQISANVLVPSIVVSACFASLIGVCVGFPSGAIIDPLIDWVRAIAKEFSPKLKSKSKTYKILPALQRNLVNGDLLFVREQSRILMACNSVNNAGTICWGFSPLKSIFEELPEEIKLEILSQCPGDDETVEVNGLIMPQAASLLHDFNPRKWVAECEQIQLQDGMGLMYRPPNFVWAQVVMLDISIRLLIRGSLSNLDADMPKATKPVTRNEVNINGMEKAMQKEDDNEEDWKEPELKVLEAIGKSWMLETPSTEVANANADHPASMGLQKTTDPEETAARLPLENNSSKNPTQPIDSTSSNDSPANTAPSAPPRPSLPARPPTPPSAGVKRSLTAWSQSVLELPENEDLINPSPQPWDLVGALTKYSGLPTEGAKAGLRIQKLADLLKLRALFFILFLMVNPDSTEVYLARDCEVEMPMI